MPFPIGSTYRPDETYDLYKQVLDEIYAQYNHKCRIGRKSLIKYGKNTSVGTTEEDITPWGGTETYLTSNAIDTLSSSESADQDIPIYIEGFTYSSGVLTFVTQTVNTDASDGQTKVLLTTPLAGCSRVRGVTTGDVYIYEDGAITAGVPDDTSKIHNQLVAGENTSLKAGTSIVDSNYFILTRFWANVGKGSGAAAADVRLRVANLGDAVLGNEFFTLKEKAINLNKGLDDTYTPFQIIKPNSHILVTASASTGTVSISAGFDGFFADIIG